MSETLFENTKVSAYFIWEYTRYESALSLWHCAEDIAYYFETKGYFDIEVVRRLVDKNRHKMPYIVFVRNVAFRLYVYTGNKDALFNWYVAEQLLLNNEWCAAIIQVARIYAEHKDNFSSLVGVRSERVKNYYSAE